VHQPDCGSGTSGSLLFCCISKAIKVLGKRSVSYLNNVQLVLLQYMQ